MFWMFGKRDIGKLIWMLEWFSVSLGMIRGPWHSTCLCWYSWILFNSLMIMSTGNFCCWIWKVVISLETAVWCSALHTTNDMETGLGVAKLWVQTQYVRSVGCLIRIRRGFRRTALNQRWGKGLRWGAQVFERKSWMEVKYNEGQRWRDLDEREWCGQWRDNENTAINEGAILEHHETIRKGRSAAINKYQNVDLKLEEWAEITCCFLQNTSSFLY